MMKRWRGDQAAVVALDTRAAGAGRQAGMQHCSNCSQRVAYSPVYVEVEIQLEASEPPAAWRLRVGHLFAPLSPQGPSACQRGPESMLNMFDIVGARIVGFD